MSMDFRVGLYPSADKLREKAGKTMVAKSAGRASQIFALQGNEAIG